jgi:hypothetical protein
MQIQCQSGHACKQGLPAWVSTSILSAIEQPLFVHGRFCLSLPRFTNQDKPLTIGRFSLLKGNELGFALKLLTLFALGVAELWAAAPAGVVMRLDPVLVCLVAAAGAVGGGTVVILLG